MAGKGSSPRPLGIPREKFNENWDQIFKKKPEQPKDNKEQK